MLIAIELKYVRVYLKLSALADEAQGKKSYRS